MWGLDFVGLFLATGALVNAWLQPDGLFSDVLVAIEVWGEGSSRRSPRANRIAAAIAELLNCRVCLSYHVAFWLAVLFYVPRLFLASPWDVVVYLPVYSLAATRLSILIGLGLSCLDLENDPENT